MQICYFQFLAEISSLLAVMRCSAVTSKHVILYSGFPFPVVEISQCYIYIQYRPLPLGLGLFACSIWGGGGMAGLTMSGRPSLHRAWFLLLLLCTCVWVQQ